MFVFDRSAFAVLVPLALLVAVALWSNRGQPAAPQRGAAVASAQPAAGDERWAANLPSR
jgi:hypothetical protein